MADELYAWSPIRVGEPASDNKPGDTKVIHPGETVTQSSTGLDDDQWKQLVESGAVKALKYPDMPNTYQGSPVQFLLEHAKRAADETVMAAQVSESNIAAIQAANAASTGVGLPPNVEPAGTPEAANTDVTVKQSDSGGWIASDDNGQSWRTATDAEVAANT